MQDDKPFESALGVFWAQSDKNIRMPGHLTIDGFPHLVLFNAGIGNVIPVSPRQTIYGVTDQGDFVSLFGTLGWSMPWTKNEDDDPNKFSEIRRGNRVDVSANYMLIGKRLFEDVKAVRQISFTSAVAERFFQLGNDDLLRRLKFVKSNCSRDIEVPLNTRQIRSFFCDNHRIRVRVFASTLPNESNKAKTKFMIDFLDLTNLDQAVKRMHGLRDLISVVCNEYADLESTEIVYKIAGKKHRADLVLYNFRSSYVAGNQWTFPMLNILSSAQLFRKIIGSWLNEADTYTIARRAFVSTLREDTILSFSDIRELVTILEMVAGKKNRPMPDSPFKKLRRKLQSLLDREMDLASEAGADTVGLAIIREKLLYLNSTTSRPAINDLITSIPYSLREGIIEETSNFASNIITLRDKITHDLSQLIEKDYSYSNDAVHKLRWICGIVDILKLGASPLDVGHMYKFHRRAFNVGETIWSREMKPAEG